MSRAAKKTVSLPKGVDCQVGADAITVKGPKGSLSIAAHQNVEVLVEDGVVRFAPRSAADVALTGTFGALIENMVIGVSEGFARKLELHGVGYRAALQGKDLNLSLGFSHPVVYSPPTGITIEVPTQTEVLVKGADKQVVGQVAARIREFRPPEPYKGKGVRYAGEKVTLKEAKKA